MAVYAEPADLESIWRPLSEEETSRVSVLMDYASAMVQQAVPDVDTWISDGSLTAQSVRYVVVQMVYRYMLNPEGKRQEQIDDYSWTRDQALSSGGLVLSDDLLSWLRPITATASTGAWTIRPWATT